MVFRTFPVLFWCAWCIWSRSMLPAGVERVSPFRTWDISGRWAGGGFLRPAGKGNTFPRCLWLVWLPIKPPLLVVLELPDVIRGTPIWFGGRNEPTRLLSLASLEFREWWDWLPFPIVWETRAALRFASLVFRPQTSLPSYFILVFLWLLLALFPDFIVALEVEQGNWSTPSHPGWKTKFCF